MSQTVVVFRLSATGTSYTLMGQRQDLMSDSKGICVAHGIWHAFFSISFPVSQKMSRPPFTLLPPLSRLRQVGSGKLRLRPVHVR